MTGRAERSSQNLRPARLDVSFAPPLQSGYALRPLTWVPCPMIQSPHSPASPLSAGSTIAPSFSHRFPASPDRSPHLLYLFDHSHRSSLALCLQGQRRKLFGGPTRSVSEVPASGIQSQHRILPHFVTSKINLCLVQRCIHIADMGLHIDRCVWDVFWRHGV